MTNWRNTVFYIGITSDLVGRVWQHKHKINPNSFTAKYNLNKLVYYTNFPTVSEAIAFEKRIKNWRRQWKIELIIRENPSFVDLSEEWFEGEIYKDPESSSG